MSTFMLQIGDVWADGHGMFEEIHVEVPDHFTAKALQENFTKAKAELKFDPKNLADGYQESRVTADQLQPLIYAGFDFSENVDARIEEDEDDIYLGPDSLVEILMFMHGYNLEGFEWNLVEKPQVLNQESFGYGLFSL